MALLKSFEYWANLQTWYLEEVACLSLGMTPDQHGGNPTARQKIISQHEKIGKTYEILRRLHEESLFERATDGFSFANWGGVRVKPKDVIEKASAFGFDFPHELVALVKKKSNKDKITGQFKKDETKVFPCKIGTKWKDIKITLISDEAVMIETPSGSRRYHFSELTMKDGRKGDVPTTSWEMLKYFCEYSGRISSTTSIDRILSLRFRNLSKSVSDLNIKLQNIFGIPESFCKKYNKRDGWVAKCIFNDNTFSA